jgi:hypothetical protein
MHKVAPLLVLSDRVAPIRFFADCLGILDSVLIWNSTIDDQGIPDGCPDFDGRSSPCCTTYLGSRDGNSVLLPTEDNFQIAPA